MRRPPMPPSTAGARKRPGASPGDGVMPPLPRPAFGAPPGRPPGATRPPPRIGGMRGIAVPPEVRRRTPGAVRRAPGAATAVDAITGALRVAQGKLLESQAKLATSVAAVRALLAARR